MSRSAMENGAAGAIIAPYNDVSTRFIWTSTRQCHINPVGDWTMSEARSRVAHSGPQAREPLPYSLAIFDLDGTLADSFPWFLRTINDIADRFSFRRVADQDIDGLRHASTREILSRLEVPLWKLPAIARHARRLKAEAASEISLFAGVEAMLRTLTENGVQLALVTSDSEANAREKLGPSAALFAYFDCAASVFGKPAKFRRVIRRAGVAPDKVIAIGDEVRDIEAARAVGIACGAVCWGYAAPATLRALGPHHVFERMDEIVGAVCPGAVARTSGAISGNVGG